jgi:hypothetical protein
MWKDILYDTTVAQTMATHMGKNHIDNKYLVHLQEIFQITIHISTFQIKNTFKC